MLKFSTRLSSRSSLAILSAALLCAGTPWSLRAAEEASPPAPSEKLSTALSGLPAMINAKNYDGALAALEALVPGLDQNSYDACVIFDTEGKIYFQGKDAPAKAAEAWEKMWAVVAKHPDYLEGKELVDHYLYTAQAYITVAYALKPTDPQQALLYDKAISYMAKWFAATPHPGQEQRVFYTSILYSKAISGGSDKVDMKSLLEAKKQAEEALVSEAKPREVFYQILYAISQQQNDYTMASKYLERLVVMKPTSKDYWGQLWAIYYNLAGTADKDPKLQRSYFTRAINSLERAQALGFNQTSKDYMNLVNFYSQVGQFGTAKDILYAGLKSGKIENTLKNWEFLAYSYRQVSQDLQAIKVLKEAEALPEFSKSGEIDRQIAEIYAELENTQEVYNYCKKAVEKGGLESKPYLTYQRLAYAAYELGPKFYDEALTYCVKGMEFPAAQKDASFARLKEGIQMAIKSRDAEAAAIKEMSK